MADVTKTTLIKVEVEGIQQATTQTEKLTKEIDKQEVSIANLREENKKLTKQRNEVDISSKEGQDKLRALNDQLDANNKKIKENVDAYTKQKIGIGDYKGALDKLVPGLGATADGISGMTKSSLAFIATPIGAVIGAIGIALVALTSYFKSTGEGQDKLTEIMKVGGVVMEGVKRVVEFVGKAIFAYVEFVAGAWKKIVDFILPSVGKAIDGAIEAGKKIAALDDEIDRKETQLIERRATVQKQVSELREKAISQEGDLKRKTIEDAIKLEKDLAAEEVNLSRMKLQQWDLEHATKKDLGDNEARERAKLAAAVTLQEKEASDSTIRFQKELERLKDENNKKADERRQIELDRREQDRLWHEEQKGWEEEAKLKADQDLAKAVQDNINRQEVNQEFLDELLQQTIDFGNAEAAEEKKQSDAEYERKVKSNKRVMTMTEMQQRLELSLLSQSFGQALSLMDQHTAAYKTLAIAKATVDTYAAADYALQWYPPPLS